MFVANSGVRNTNAPGHYMDCFAFEIVNESRA